MDPPSPLHSETEEGKGDGADSDTQSKATQEYPDAQMGEPGHAQESQGEEEWQQPKTKRQKKRRTPMQLQFFHRAPRPPASIAGSQVSEGFLD